MLMMIYSHLMFIIMRIAVFLFAGDLEINVQASALISILLSLDVMITISIYFVPKIMAARSDSPGNDSHNIFHRSSSVSSVAEQAHLRASTNQVGSNQNSTGQQVHWSVDLSANQETQASENSAGHWSVASIIARANQSNYDRQASYPGDEQGNSQPPSCLRNDGAKLSTATKEIGTQCDISIRDSVSNTADSNDAIEEEA